MTLAEELRNKADEIDRSVARDKDDRDTGVWGEIELMRRAADALDLIPKDNPALVAVNRRRQLEREIAAAIQELKTL
jgi:hypothetical protein